MATVRSPKIVVEYNGKNITTDLTPHLLSLVYTDHVKGKSDEVEISLEDTDARWRNEWYPQKGDTIRVQIGYSNQMVDCGDFDVDEIELQGPPDTVNIRGMAASIKKAMRTRNNKAHENKTLKDIAQATASALSLKLDDGTKITKVKRPDTSEEKRLMINMGRYGLQIAKQDTAMRLISSALLIKKMVEVEESLKKKGYTDEAKLLSGFILKFNGTEKAQNDVNIFVSDIATSLRAVEAAPKEYTKKSSIGLDKVRLTRSTQTRETDLEYLRRLSEMYGYSFSVRGDTMYFYHYEDIEGADSVNKIDRSDLISYSFKDKATNVYKSAKVSYHDPKTKSVIQAEHNPEAQPTADGGTFDNVTSDDVLEIRTRVENKQQAEQVAKAALHEHNSKTQTASVTVIGNPLYVAGNNIEITGMGALSGKFHIEQSTHKIDRSGGYTCDLELKRVGLTVKKAEQKAKPKKSTPAKARTYYVTGNPFLTGDLLVGRNR